MILEIVSSECWKWPGPFAGKGYGSVSINGKKHYVHRLSWQLKSGRKPKKFILHKCDEPACFNPDHLYEGDCKQNMKDMVNRGRHWCQKNPGSQRGEGNHAAKLNKKDIEAILSLHKAGLSQKAISDKFPISRTHVGRIVRRESWT